VLAFDMDYKLTFSTTKRAQTIRENGAVVTIIVYEVINVQLGSTLADVTRENE